MRLSMRSGKVQNPYLIVGLRRLKWGAEGNDYLLFLFDVTVENILKKKVIIRAELYIYSIWGLGAVLWPGIM